MTEAMPPSGNLGGSDPGGAGQRLEVRLLQAEVDFLASKLGEDNLRTLRARVILGNAQRANGDLKAAMATLAEAFEAAERVGDTQLAISSGRELGLTLLASSRLSEAAGLLSRMLEATAEQYGKDSPEWAAAAEELALALRARGDLVGALRLQRAAFETSRRTLGELDPVTWIFRMNLASVTNINRMLLPLGGPAVNFAPRFGAKEKIDWPGLALSERGTIHPDRGEFEASLESLRTVQKSYVTFSTPTSLTAWIDSARARALSSSDDPEQMREGYRLARRVLDERSSALGDFHPQTLSSMLLVANAAVLHDIGHGVKVGREAARASEAILGRGHVDTLGAYESLAALLERQGEEGEAGDLRRENILLRAADEGIIGDAQPPIENLAGTLTEPLAPLERVLAPGAMVELGGGGEAPAIDVSGAGHPLEEFADANDEAGGGLVTRTAHAELDPAREIEPGERFEVCAYVDCAPPEGPGSAGLELRPAPGVTALTLRAWLVVSRHFEVEGDAIKPLELDLNESSSPRLVFPVRALRPPEYSEHYEEDPEVRVLFSYLGWPSGEVRLPVPLAQPTPEPAP